MKVRKKIRRSDYPEVSCLVPGCSAKTRTIAPPCEAMICRRCWRRAPKQHRDFYSRMSARLTRARNRQSPEVELFERLLDYAFERVRESLMDEGTETELPAVLAEQLRKDGLI